jgi:hypothetical protein
MPREGSIVFGGLVGKRVGGREAPVLNFTVERFCK